MARPGLEIQKILQVPVQCRIARDQPAEQFGPVQRGKQHELPADGLPEQDALTRVCPVAAFDQREHLALEHADHTDVRKPARAAAAQISYSPFEFFAATPTNLREA